MQDFSLLDGVALAIGLIAVTRGFFIGLIRESFSIAALGAACVAVSYGNPAAAAWLHQVTGGQIGAGAAPWISGAAIAIASVLLVGMIGRWLKRGAQAAGLGWADRLGGGALGAAEGALVVALIVVAASWLVGRDHPQIAQSRTIEAYDQVEAFVRSNAGELPEVAAPPPLR